MHGGAEPGEGHTLRLAERGTTGEAANLDRGMLVRRAQFDGARVRPRGVETAARLPGPQPAPGDLRRGAGIETRTLGLGATNGWFAMQLRVFSLPLAESEVDQRVAENWSSESTLSPSLPEAFPALRRSQVAALEVGDELLGYTTRAASATRRETKGG